MIKLLAIDLDGTMYKSDRSITPRVRDSIKKANENGIQPLIVTGRGRQGAETALESLGMDFPYICSAGALIKSGRGGKTTHAWAFHKHKEMMHIIDFSRNNEIGLIADHQGGSLLWFATDNMKNIIDPLTFCEMKKGLRSFDPENDMDIPMLKMTIAAEPALLAQIDITVNRDCPSFHLVHSGTHYIDLTAEGVNKGTALKAVAEQRGLHSNEIAAIGDQYIDMHMLKYAGLPIAVSNAVPEVKQFAKWVAPSNDDDGVAWAIDEILKVNRYN